MRSRITDVIFDLDGTLIDSAPSILACFANALARQGVQPALPLTEALIGPPLRETLQKLSGVEDDVQLRMMIDDFKQHYDSAGYKETVVFPGVDDMLHELKDAGLSLHIATNKRKRPTDLILSHLGWAELFSGVYASDMQNPPFANKSTMLSVLIQEKKVSPAKAVYVGDRSDDKLAAENNALGFIAAMWGYHDVDLMNGDHIDTAHDAATICRVVVDKNNGGERKHLP